MKHTLYTFWLLIILSAAAPSLRAQCTLDAGPDLTLTCTITQVQLSATATPANVNYSWSGPGFTSTQPNPTVELPGLYSVTITDPGSGCTATDNVMVSQDIVAPSITATGGVLNCFSPVVTLVGTTNVSNAIFQWAGPGITGSNQNQHTPQVLLAGLYTLTVTNPNNGCTSTATASVTGDLSVPSLTATGGTITCSQPNVTLVAASTTSGAVFYWIGPATFSSNVQNPVTTVPGSYTVIVTGPNGCTASQTVTVDVNGSFPTINISSLSITQPSCAGLSDGAISSVLPSGGTGPYTFAWSGPGGFLSTAQNLANLAAGAYVLTLTDMTGCHSVNSPITLTAPAALTIAQISMLPINCYGESTGSLFLGVAGGTFPNTFLWSNGSTTANLQNVPAGSYSVTITDAHGCSTVSAPIVVSQPPPLVVESLICEGSITAIASGGVPPYSYTWSNGENGPTANPQLAGSYFVTVQDAHGCPAFATIDLLPGLNPSCTRIIGRVVLDQNADCLPNLPEIGLGIWYVKAEGVNGTFYGVTDLTGHYDLRLVPGDYTVSVLPPSPLYTVCVPTVAASLLQVGDSVTVNFAAQGANPNCPAMTVDLTTGVLRRCFSTNYYNVHYCNNSPAAAPQAYIQLTLDPFMSIVSAQKPYIALGNNVFQFDLDSVGPFECSQFYVQVKISCDAMLGQTHCSEAHIFPDTLCSQPNVLWTGAELAVHSECTTDSLHFILQNIGTGPMTNNLEYIVIEDGIMGLQGVAPPLAAGASMVVSVPANGSTWRIEALQAEYFPGLSIPVLSVEGCTTSSSFSTGYVQQFTTNDADPFVDVDCTANIGSYDPNDKQGMPLGYGAEHYIRPGTDLEYLVRFQNTGTDTAFTVIVRDTLDPWLDPATVRPGGSSHPYHFEMVGNGILIFEFQHILLPDSNVNEAASHGYLSYRVSQRAGVPLESSILNRAAIYFDFNDPVLTNTTVHRIGEQFVVVGLWQPEQTAYRVHIAPHPLRDASWLEVQGVAEAGNYQLRLYDATGRPVQTMRSASPRFRVEKAGLPAGVYLFRVDLDGVLVGRGTLVAQ